MTKKIVFQIFLIACSLAFLGLAYLAKINNYFYFDLLITKSIQQFNPPWFIFLMKFLSLFGDTFLVILSLTLGSLCLWLINKKGAITLFLSSTGAIILSEVLKFIVARPRPDANIVHQFSQFQRNDSFPSGHVLFFIGFYGYLLYLVYKNHKKDLAKNLLMFFLISLIILIGVSRIYLGAHWLSDVLGAYLIGIVYLTLVIRFLSAQGLK